MAKGQGMSNAPREGGRAKARLTTKEKVRKKRGERIAGQKQRQRIKHSKLERQRKKEEIAARPVKTPVLMRHEEGDGDGAAAKKPRKDPAFTDRMNVDDFMEHGFMKAMEEDDSEDEDVEQASGSE